MRSASPRRAKTLAIGTVIHTEGGSIMMISIHLESNSNGVQRTVNSMP